MKRLALALALAAAPLAGAFADDAAIEVHLKNHKFTPSVIKVKANKPSMIILHNDDDSADEVGKDPRRQEPTDARTDHGRGRHPGILAYASGREKAGELPRGQGQEVVLNHNEWE